jgi:hypothetical protein
MPFSAEAQQLAREAKRLVVFLVTAALASFFLGFFLIQKGSPCSLFGIALLGFSGSAIAALTSCVDRYANGFELDDGSKEPAKAQGETFNHRMATWFYVRPFLGVVAAPLLIWGLAILVKNPDQFEGSPKSLAFTGFLGGLLAKSVFELIKDLFKRVFKG